MRRFIFCFLVSINVQTFLFSLQAVAQSTTITPAVTIKPMVNDNYFFDRSTDEKTDVSSVTATPFLMIDYDGPRLDLNSRIQADIVRYFDETQLDTENQWYLLNSHWHLTDKWNIFGKLGYTYDRPIERSIDTTREFAAGQIVANLASRRKVYDASAGTTYQLTRSTEASVDFTYNQIDYDSSEEDSSKTYSASGSVDHFINHQRDNVSILPDYYHFDSQTTTTDYYGLAVAWSHMFSRASSFSVSFGGQHTIKNTEEAEDDDWGWRSGLTFGKKWKSRSISLGYTYDVFTSTDDTIQVHAATGTFQNAFTERLSAVFYFMFYWPEETRTDVGNVDYANFSDYYELAPAINYRLTKNSTLSLSGDYTLYDQADRERTRAWVAYTYEFPVSL